MLKILFITAMFCMTGHLTYAATEIPKAEKINEEEAPAYIYKVLSVQDWNASQGTKSVKLPADDAHFINLATKDQLTRVIIKYWASSPDFVILRLETKKLPGKLVLEVNPGGSTKYYHLYNGSIPLDAVAESHVMQNPSK